MKTLLAVLFLSSFLFAQNKQKVNPDGDRISVHLTPFIVSGSNEIANGGETDIQNFSTEFNIRLLVKIPLHHTFTLSPFVTTDNFSYEQETFLGQDSSIKKFSTYKTKYGATLSFYF